MLAGNGILGELPDPVAAYACDLRELKISGNALAGRVVQAAEPLTMLGKETNLLFEFPRN